MNFKLALFLLSFSIITNSTTSDGNALELFFMDPNFNPLSHIDLTVFENNNDSDQQNVSDQPRKRKRSSSPDNDRSFMRLAKNNNPFPSSPTEYESDNESTSNIVQKTHPTPYLKSINASSQDKSNRPRNYECDFCIARFQTSRSLKDHQRSIHQPTDQLICNYGCTGKFPNKHNLSRHHSHWHEQKKISENKPSNQHLCTLCLKTFDSSSKLKRHEISHNKLKSHTCPVCNMNCAQIYSLKTHIKRQHPDNANYKCQKCDAIFATTKQLSTHLEKYYCSNQESNRDGIEQALLAELSQDEFLLNQEL